MDKKTGVIHIGIGEVVVKLFKRDALKVTDFYNFALDKMLAVKQLFIWLMQCSTKKTLEVV